MPPTPMEDARNGRAAVSDAPFDIVLAEDDPDDRLFTRRALEKNDVTNVLHTVEDGEELLDFLHRRSAHVLHRRSAHAGREGPQPGLVLLDLNMPRMYGREALRKMKNDPALRRIPVIVLTTSQAEQDVLESYELGVNAFVTKPVTFEGRVEAFQRLGGFWFEVVELPR
jgi:CheY-like chemotaxis protein